MIQYWVAKLLCNEFITSKTFLLEFANYKTFEGRLTRVVGKRNIKICALSAVWDHSNILTMSYLLLLREYEITAERLF